MNKASERQARYDGANTKQIHLKLNLKTDADILEKLEQVESIQGYIKGLIRSDIGGQEDDKKKMEKNDDSTHDQGFEKGR